MAGTRNLAQSALRDEWAVFATGGNGGSPSWLKASGQDRAKLAGGEELEGAKAFAQFGGGQAVLAVELLTAYRLRTRIPYPP